jgi:hypothetical protein
MVQGLVLPLSVLSQHSTTILTLDTHFSYVLQIPHHSYSPHQTLPSLLTLQCPIYLSKNLHHKRELILPSPTITATMNIHGPKQQSIANDGSGTPVPLSTTVIMSKTPPENIQQLKAAFSLVTDSHTLPSADAPYPPCGCHHSDQSIDPPPIPATIPR